MRDDDIVRRAQLWATGATIHNVTGLIGLYRSGAWALDHKEDYGSDSRPWDEIERIANQNIDTARRRLESYMSHGDYRKACRSNPWPDGSVF